jgi:hypothetical protein
MRACALMSDSAPRAIPRTGYARARKKDLTARGGCGRSVCVVPCANAAPLSYFIVRSHGLRVQWHWDPIEGSGTRGERHKRRANHNRRDVQRQHKRRPVRRDVQRRHKRRPVRRDVQRRPVRRDVQRRPSGETSSADTSTGEVHCTLKLDVLFLLARSEGMLTIQEKIRSAQTNLFAGLSLADVNVRIMVSDLDRVPGAEECEDLLCAQNNDDSCAPLDDSYPCDHSPDDCDVLYGASVTFPWGIGAANKDCGFGGEYLSTVDTDALACALTLGEGTQAVDFGATLENVLGATNEPCNNGFIRDDAKLLVVIASNSDDTSFGSASDWIATVSDLRPLDSIVLAQNTTDTPKIDEFAAALPFVIKGNGDSDFFSNAAALTLATYCK